jgi:hypothetical protein
MGVFEYVMVLVSIVVGLAITHILSATGATVHRLRGHGEPIRLEPVFLLWVGYVLTYLVSFWWWEFRFQGLQGEWTFGLYLFVITYAISLFLLTVILIPNRMEEVNDSYEYFMAGRRWFFGANLIVTGIDMGDTLLKGLDWFLRPSFLVQEGVLISVFVVGLISNRRPVQLTAAAIAFTVLQIFMFQEIGIV